MKIFLLINPEEKSLNYNKEFISKVTVVPLVSPPKNFLSKFSDLERKRIYTHLQIWKNGEAAIIIEETTYTNLSSDELFNYLNFDSVDIIDESLPEIYFYGKYNSMCLTHCNKRVINEKFIYKTQACAGAYAYMINAKACQVFTQKFENFEKFQENLLINKGDKLERNLDQIFFNLTYSGDANAYVYHPSILKLMSTTTRCEYECMNPNDECHVEKKEWTVRTYMNWFIFLCLLLLAFFVGLLLYYIYRIGFTSKCNKIISTGYYESQ